MDSVSGGLYVLEQMYDLGWEVETSVETDGLEDRLVELEAAVSRIRANR
jgi:hypothetical protein